MDANRELHFGNAVMPLPGTHRDGSRVCALVCETRASNESDRRCSDSAISQVELFGSRQAAEVDSARLMYCL